MSTLFYAHAKVSKMPPKSQQHQRKPAHQPGMMTICRATLMRQKKHMLANDDGPTIRLNSEQRTAHHGQLDCRLWLSCGANIMAFLTGDGRR